MKRLDNTSNSPERRAISFPFFTITCNLIQYHDRDAVAPVVGRVFDCCRHLDLSTVCGQGTLKERQSKSREKVSPLSYIFKTFLFEIVISISVTIC
jgi:hypothetical protein